MYMESCGKNEAELINTSIHFFRKSSEHGLCSGKTPGFESCDPERATP